MNDKAQAPDRVKVPQPPLKPVIGNLAELDAATPVQSLMRLARQYGPFFKMRVVDREMYVVSSQELVDELSDETRFIKRLHAPLVEIRAFAGDGLFTAYSEEPNWALAHRILMPAFGPLGVREMFPQMLDIADQMFLRWERFGPDSVIDVPDNMTRLTLDTIALCAFDYRFNSFYKDEMHPFVDAMVGALAESGARSRRPKLMTDMMRAKARTYRADIALMQSVARDLIARRRALPAGSDMPNDLLGRMLAGRDPETGAGLSDDNIMHQMITFLIAGHETTSGMLSFATYLLLKNPVALRTAREQVDAVLGDAIPTIEHLGQLRYIERVLMESLRLWPTAPAYALKPLADTVIGGQYAVTTKDTLLVLTPILHRDPKVWDDAETFRPERFAPDAAAHLPPNAWKPFGTGARACIGRPFAMQEAVLVLARMLQRFDFAFDNPAYDLRVHETLTLKPENLRIRVRPRGTGAGYATGLAGPAAMPPRPLQKRSEEARLPDDAPALLVLYGSNSGSAQAFAERIGQEAAGNGFAARVAPLDAHADDLPRDGAVAIVTASYEGQPPDNAKQFVAGLADLEPAARAGVRYALFGCGNRQWARTYQAVPKAIDAALSAAGATRLCDRGEGDSGGDFFGAFDEWLAGFWPALAAAFGTEAAAAGGERALPLRFVDEGREATLRLGDLQPGLVVENRELVDMAAPGARSKRHVEIRLPDGMTYAAGDYLAVLPQNDAAIVDRALRALALTRDRMVVIDAAASASQLPTGHPISVGEILTSYVELAQPVTRAQVAALADATRCPPERSELEALAGDRYDAEVFGRRVTLLDLLERFPSVTLTLDRFLAMLPPMRARQYSISSSPLWRPDHVTLTVAVVDAPALSGAGQYRGVASNYLAQAAAGDRIAVTVRPSQARFHPPEDVTVPMVMVCAGSGIAPFRGFLQERAAQAAAGRDVARSLLFFGTNDPAVDDLYADELAEWARDGVVDVYRAYSEAPDGDIAFVQHRLWAERDAVIAAFVAGGSVFVCGDGRHMAPAVRDTLVRIYREQSGASEADANVWAEAIERDHGRYVADVFA